MSCLTTGVGIANEKNQVTQILYHTNFVTNAQNDHQKA